MSEIARSRSAVFAQAATASLQRQALENFSHFAATRSGLYLDVSDLILYFLNGRTPTGIQRVILALAETALKTADDVCLCAFDLLDLEWKALDRSLFLSLAALVHGSAQSSANWHSVVEKIGAAISASPPLAFAESASLLCLGSPWHIAGYFRGVRRAKLQYRISYVAFVHDTIPYHFPEYCEEQVPLEYARWLYDVAWSADLVLANSLNTRRDFLAAVSKLSDREVPCEVVHLNGDFQSAVQDEEKPSEEVQAFLSLKYALFVGTIEPRKNHLLVLHAWRTLLRALGPETVPTLILAGKLGWQYEAPIEFIRKSNRLDGKVVVLSDVSDVDLKALYRNARFTIYNSQYEGWGLPVTESLSFGKIPLVARNSGLEESGGEHAIFFEANSEPSLVEAIRRVLADPGVLADREALLRTWPATRAWREIFEEIRNLSTSAGLVRNSLERERVPKPLRLGEVYWFGLEEITSRARGSSGLDFTPFENFGVSETVRHGEDWHAPEEWGVWTRSRTFRFAFHIDGFSPERGKPHGRLLLFLRLRGHHQDSIVRAEVGGLPARELNVSPSADKILIVTVPQDCICDGRFSLTLVQDTFTDLREPSGGIDSRRIGIGVRYFMLCEESDVEARLRFLELAILQDKSALKRGSPADLSTPFETSTREIGGSH